MFVVVTDAKIPEFDFKCKIGRCRTKKINKNKMKLENRRKSLRAKSAPNERRTEQIEFSFERLTKQEHSANRFECTS